MDIESTRNTAFPITDARGWRRIYLCRADGYREELDESKLIMIVGNSLQSDKWTKMPVSKLKSLQKPISNIIAELDARNNLITRRGALGIFSSEAQAADKSVLPLPKEKKLEILDEMQKTYGITGGRSPFAVVSAAVKWQSLAMNVKELALHEEHKESTADLCDRLGYPFYLMGGKDGTFNNVGEAGKYLYQNTIMPLAAAIDETLNRALRTGDSNVVIITDYSHIEALQEGEKERADAERVKNMTCLAQWNAGLITLNQWLLKIGMDIVSKNELYILTKPYYDQYLRDNGVTPIPLPNEQGKEAPKA